MRDVQFIKPAARWQPGDIASFSDDDARYYVRRGVATDAGETPARSARIPHPGEPDYNPLLHAALHGQQFAKEAEKPQIRK